MFTRNRSLRRRSRAVVEASIAPCVEELERRQLLSNVPNAPFALSATAASSTTVNLSFYDSASNETGFVIQKATSPSGPFSTVTTLPAAAGSGTKVTFSDTSDVGSTTYTYKVFAVNGAYQSSAPSVQVTTPSGAPPAPPADPSNLQAGLSGSNILVSFTDNSNNETDFQVLRSTSAGGTYAQVGTVTGDASTGGTKQFTDKTGQAGQTYFYEVFAENSGGPSSTVGPTSGVSVPVPTPPNAPSGLSAALSGNGIIVTFTDNSNNENDFVVQRSTNPSSGFATVGTVNGDAATGTKTFTDNGVAANTTYYYQIYSENGAGPSAIVGPSNGVTTPQNSGTNPGGPPNGPYVFSATPVSAGQVNLAFYDSATNETGFVIQRSTSSSGPFVNVATLPPNPGSGNKITYTDTTTAGTTTYFYKVFAVNGPYTSGVANTSCTTPAGATAPAAPSGLGAALSGSNVVVSFTDNSTNEADFQVLRSTTQNGTYTPIATIPGDAATGAKQYTDNSVAPGTTYYYEIFAENAVGPSSTVGPTSGVTTPPAQTAPNAPSNPGAALSGKNVVVSFTDNSTNETDFQVLRSTTQNGTYTEIGTVLGDAGTGAKQYTDTTAAAGGTYFYEVFAENGVGPSSTVGPTSGVTTPVPPADPSNLGASLSGNSIVISFSDNSTNETDFVIERSTSPGGTFSSIKTIAGDAATGTEQYTDNTVLAGTTYYYEVFAENAAGPSSVIGPTTGVTTPAAPNAPTNLSTSLSGASVVVSFTDNSTNENDFQVLRSTNPSSGFVSVQTITGDAATGTKQWTDNSVSQGVTYYYEVFAENNVGPSTTLGPSSGITVPNNGNAPAAPTGLLATVEGLHVGISFNDVSNNESDFQIQRSTSPGSGFATVNTITGDATTGIQLFTDLGVSVGTTYYYRVIAENGGGQVIVGPTAGVVPVDTNGIAPGTNPGGPPNGPYGLTTNAINSGSVQIQFVDNSTNETGFVILRATSSGGPYTQIGTMPPFANSHVLQSFVDIGVAPSTTYFYKVYAVNGPYASNTAGPSSATTPSAGSGNTPTGPWVPYAKLIGLDKERVDFPQIDGSGVTVAMMDRGVDYNAPGLSAGKIIGGFNFRDNNTNLLDDYGHGTGVAGIIAAGGYNYNGQFNEGVATNANLVVMKQESSANIKNALDWLIANAAKFNVQVLNLTDFVTDVNNGAWNPQVYNSELQTLWNMGIFICSPVGNGEVQYGPNAPITYPSLSPYVVGVGGVNQDGTMYADGLRGNGLDVLGPANNVTMPYYVRNPNDPGFSQFDDKYDGTGAIINYAIGTSWASAYTAGTAALIKQVNQKITPDEILSILKQTGAQVSDPENPGVSYPMINADKAVAMAEQLYGPNGTSTP